MSNPEQKRRMSYKDYLTAFGRVGIAAILLKLGGVPIFAQDNSTPTPTPDNSGAEITGTPTIEALFNQTPDLLEDYTQMTEGPFQSENFNVIEGSVIKTEAQNYKNDPGNVRIEKYTDPETGESFNTLVLQALKKQDGDKEYTSARLELNKNIKYGKIEVTAMFPSGAGAFPALWLRSRDQSNSQNATAEQAINKFKWALNGEIDFAETQGAEPTIINSTAHSYETLNKGGNPNGNKTEVSDATTSFHVYGVEWTPEKIVMTIDGVQTNEIDIQKEADGSYDPAKAPWQHDMYLVMNFAMGGTWAESVAKRLGLDLPNGIDDTQSDAWKLRIKDVKIFDMTDQ